MIRDPIHPVIHANLTWIMVKEFGLTPMRAAKFTTQFIGALHRRDFDIVRGSWMHGEATRKDFKWEDLGATADLLEAERNGISPWNPPELTTSGTSGEG